MSFWLKAQFILGDEKLFLYIDKQLSFGSLLQWIILLLGKKILIKPIHLKFKGALSVSTFSSKLNKEMFSKYWSLTKFFEKFCSSPAKFSNTCWSLVHKNDGIKVGATYKATDEKIAKVDGFISATNESADLRKATYEESEGWYAGITADMFG